MIFLITSDGELVNMTNVVSIEALPSKCDPIEAAVGGLYGLCVNGSKFRICACAVDIGKKSIKSFAKRAARLNATATFEFFNGGTFEEK